MRLLIDTNYLLPAIGVSLRGIPPHALLELQGKGHSTAISEISIFELAAKGGKYISEQKLTSDRVTRGIRAIIHDETLERISFHETTVLTTAFELRGSLVDFIDCLILSSAVCRCDALVTEDEDITRVASQDSFKELIRASNPRFKVHSLEQVLRRSKGTARAE
ncbi:MAG: PIN domain-containing protein [Candidatus Bathyarchaeia archaeon]